MGAKSGFVVGFGVGYVLGAKAGRQRYEQIVRWWEQFTGSPTVQRAAERTKVAAEESAKMGLQAVQRGVEKAGSAVKDRLHRSNETPEGLVSRQGI
jgi:vacuolar-type H+-ATPase subunit E/Vma4